MITFDALKSRAKPIVVVGLGYVGLPLALAFARHFTVIGFDISEKRVQELSAGLDRTDEVDASALAETKASFTADPAVIRQAGLVVVAVPTPIDQHRRPDFTPIVSASRTVGDHLAPGAVVVYESTVYPGLTEETCGPILEERSGLVRGRDFKIGYSPERINPGDKINTLETIVKVAAGEDEDTADLLVQVYETVVKAGVHRASCIKVAEAAKVIENTQRDLNIALMNELAIIFEKLGIDTLEVLQAAGTKWNFLPFRPGLVGGHCIGVDPYYLTFKAEALGLHPQVILAGRRINDHMGKHVAETAVKKLIQLGLGPVNGARVGVLGLTFKENVPDLRNTRVVDVIAELREYRCQVLVHDPLADPEEARHEYGLELSPLAELRDLDCLVLAVPHADYQAMSLTELADRFRKPGQGLLLDIKGCHSPAAAQAAGLTYWRL